MISLAAFGFPPFDVSWLSVALVLTTPILLAAIGELVSERAGVLNVGLDGMMLCGAFFSYYVTYVSHSLVLGLLAGMGGGLFIATVMALLAVEAGADQIVSGVGLNLAAIGITSYLFNQLFSSKAEAVVPTIKALKIPGLASIPHFGPALFDHDPVLYAAFLLVPVVAFMLYRTRWGLAVRAAGEMPAAADTAGISVRRVRWMGTLTAGALAGLGGVSLAIVQVGIFHQQMTGGRGFLALVAVIFGRWKALGVLGACLALGGADALQLRLVDQPFVPKAVWVALAVIAAAVAIYMVIVRRGAPKRTGLSLSGLVIAGGLVLLATTPHVVLPLQLWQSLPYLLALLVLAAGVTRVRMPANLTIPYHRGDR
jgi:general nucleoside transport system permease protein